MGHEEFPDACIGPAAEDMAPPVPGVEVAHYADPAGVGGPDGEIRALHALPGGGMGPHPLVRAQEGALGVEIPVQFPHHGPEAVGVHQLHGIPPSVHPEAVGEGLAPAGQMGLEDPLGMGHLHFKQCLSRFRLQ